MTISRRDWLAATGLGLAGARADAFHVPALRADRPAGPGFDPWLEMDAQALAHNAATLSRLAGGRQILAMAKNNAYGLGLATAGPLLDRIPEVWGFGVVRPGEGFALRAAGVRKPVLLLGPASDEEALALVRRNVRLAPCTASDAEQLIRLSARLGSAIAVHLYVDTGMHRMGLPYDQVPAWL